MWGIREATGPGRIWQTTPARVVAALHLTPSGRPRRAAYQQPDQRQHVDGQGGVTMVQVLVLGLVFHFKRGMSHEPPRGRSADA